MWKKERCRFYCRIKSYYLGDEEDKKGGFKFAACPRRQNIRNKGLGQRKKEVRYAKVLVVLVVATLYMFCFKDKLAN